MFWKRYMLALFITLALFGVAFYLSGQLSSRKIDEVRAIQDKIATDILSTETRFVLLGASSCDHVVANNQFENDLSSELANMARRVKFMENELGYNDERVVLIKEQYTLFQIKDYILQKQLTERCGAERPTILYFHGPDCKECQGQSIVLDELHDTYKNVRIYWLDSGITMPAMQTIISMFKIKTVPSLVIGKDTLVGFQSLDVLSALMPEEKILPKESGSTTESSKEDNKN